MNRRILLVCLFLCSCARNSEYYLASCKEHFGKGDFGNSILDCRKALQQSPQNGEAYYWLGLSYVKENKGTEAYQALLSAITYRREDEQAREAFADVALSALLNSGNSIPALYKDVADSAEWLLKKNPDSVPGLRLKGSLAVLDKRAAEAIEYFQKCLQLQPNDSSIQLRLSRAYFLAEQFPAGEKTAMAIIERNRNFGPAYDLLHDQYILTGRQKDAEQILIRKSNSVRDPFAYVQLAYFYAKANRPSERDAAIEKIIARKDDSKRFLTAGDFYLSVNDPEQAIRLYEKGLATDSREKPELEKKLVNALLLQHRDQDALNRIQQYLKNDPKDFDARAARASLNLEHGKLDEALAEFKVLSQERPEDGVVRYNYGRAYVARKDWEAAATEFQASIVHQPNLIPPRILLAEISLILGRTDAAGRWAQEVIDRDNENQRAHLLHAIAMKERGQLELAQAELLKLKAKNPGSADVQLQLGLLELARGRSAEAEKIFAGLNTRDSGDSRALLGLSEVLSVRNQSGQALAMLAQRLKQSPSQQVLRAYVSLAMKTGKYDDAIAELGRLIGEKPGTTELLSLLGTVQRAKGDMKGALAAFEKARQTAPNSIELKMQIAYTHQLEGNRDAALRSYRELVGLQPQNTILMNNLAELLAGGGTKEVEEAQTLVQRALQSSPNNPHYEDTLGMIYLRKNMADGALQIFRKVAAQLPENASFHYHLGLALRQSGNPGEARAAFEKALSKRPSAEEARQIEAVMGSLPHGN